VALPAEPPRYGTWGQMVSPISRASSPSPWATYALQRAIGVKPATGHFGAVTHKRLKEWQRTRGLTADGVAGPKTQQRILREAGDDADRKHGLPQGLGRGFAKAEGANILAATNWSVPGGVDCGPGQFRISGPPFSLEKLKRAFRPYVSLDHACELVKQRAKDAADRNVHLKRDPQTAFAVAVLYHHWPAAAERIIDRYPGDGHWWRYVPSPDEPAGWVPGDYTRASWAREYVARVLLFVA
jgi:hypothetical protein